MPYQGAVVAWDGDGGMVCLTDLWRAAGSPPRQRPVDWMDTLEAQRYIEACCRRENNVVASDLIFTRQGRGDAGAGTWATKLIGLGYAQYLNADLYAECNAFVLAKWGQSRSMGNDADRALLLRIAEHLGVEDDGQQWFTVRPMLKLTRFESEPGLYDAIERDPLLGTIVSYALQLAEDGKQREMLHLPWAYWPDFWTGAHSAKIEPGASKLR